MTRTVLVTGGAGFVGSCMAEKLLSDPENYVVIVDSLATGDLRKLPPKQTPNYKFIKADCNDFNDISSVFYSYSFDIEKVGKYFKKTSN